MPYVGTLLTWTLKIFKKILILINFSEIFTSLGASALPMYVIIPSAGETIKSSDGMILFGSLKKIIINKVKKANISPIEGKNGKKNYC